MGVVAVFRRGGLAAVAVVVLLGVPSASFAETNNETAPDSGIDILRRTRVIDLHLALEREGDEDVYGVTFRTDTTFDFTPKRHLKFRIELPFKAIDSKEGRSNYGLGDVLVQAVYVLQSSETEGLGIGAQLILPTAESEQYGRGQFRIRPTVGYRVGLLALPNESFVQLLVRYDHSIGAEHRRDDMRALLVAPTVEFGLPHDSFVSVFPSADIRYDFVHDTLFVPANIEVGKRFKRGMVSFELGKSLFAGDRPIYDWKAQARFALRF